MERTDEHDVLMLREMVVSDVFSFKKGSVSRGDAWDSIAEKLNQIDSPQFRIKDKRSVRKHTQSFHTVEHSPLLTVESGRQLQCFSKARKVGFFNAELCLTFG